MEHFVGHLGAFLIGCWFEFLLYGFLEHLSERRFHGRFADVYLFSWFGIGSIILFCCAKMNNFLVDFCSYLFVSQIINVSCYKNQKKCHLFETIAYTLGFQFVISITNLFLIMAEMLYLDNNFHANQYNFFIVKMIGCAMTYLGYSLYKRSVLFKQQNLQIHFYIRFYCVVGISLAYISFVYGFIRSNPTRNMIAILEISVVLISFFVTLIIVYNDYYIRLTQMRGELKSTKGQFETSYEYIQKLEEKYTKSQQLMHDMQNHLQIIEGLYMGQSNNQAQEYCSTLVEHIKKTKQIHYVDNKALDILLHSKKQLADAQNVRCIYFIDEFPMEFIKDFDWITLFGNLIDNALTECSNGQDGEIVVKVKKRNHLVVIQIINTMFTIINTESDREDLMQNIQKGTGLKNVCEVVRNYNGDINFDFDNKKFEVYIQFII